jgi:hypothetical protein
MIPRRRLLALLASAAVAPRALLGGPAAAIGEASRFTIAELDLGPGTLSRPGAWERLLNEVRATTSVETRDASRAAIPRLAPSDPKLFEHPFVVCPGDGAFAVPGEAGLEQLSRYLAYGGFLLFDDATGAVDSPFDRAVRRLASVLFPTRRIGALPRTHSVYRSFFLLDRPLGRVARFDDLEGITVGGVRVEGDRREDTTNSPMILMRNDLSGALDRSSAGRDVNPVVPGGEAQRREAVKLGINLVMYSLTSNYKKDQVHVKELIDRNRLPRSMFGFPP